MLKDVGKELINQPHVYNSTVTFTVVLGLEKTGAAMRLESGGPTERHKLHLHA